jgi:hyperosmotically inducible protein
MRAFRIGFLTVALAAFGLAATDNELIDTIRVKLTQDVDVNGGALDVTVKEGIVTLRGPVRSDKAKKKAEKIAGKVKGVKKVVNETTVSPNTL